MPNGIDNPYLDEQTGFFDIIDPNWGSLAQLGLGWMPGAGYVGGGQGGNYASLMTDSEGNYIQPGWVDPAYWDPSEIGQAIGFDVPIYSYSGLSEPIMAGLQNVFAFPGTEDGWENSIFAEQFGDVADTLAQWQEFLGSGYNWPALNEIATPELTGEGLDVNILGYDPESGSIGDTLLESGEITTALPFVNVFDEQSLASFFDVAPGTLRALTPEQLAKTTTAYYDPYIEKKGEDFVAKKGEKLAKAGTGGFAGSGARASGLSGAEQMYGDLYTNLFSQIEKMKAEQEDDILEQIYGWTS